MGAILCGFWVCGCVRKFVEDLSTIGGTCLRAEGGMRLGLWMVLHEWGSTHLAPCILWGCSGLRCEPWAVALGMPWRVLGS